MDVTPWRNTLYTLTGEQGWIGRRDAKASLAADALQGYERTGGWIGHGFEAIVTRVHDAEAGKLVDRVSKPDAAYAAELKRDAILELAVMHELARREVRRAGDQDGFFDDLVPGIVRAAMTSRHGLRAKAGVSAPQKGRRAGVDFAHGDTARRFFEGTVRERLQRVDHAMGTRLAALAGDRYRPDDEASIDRWGRVWTAAAVLVCLDWTRQKRCRSARDVARALWCRTGPEGEPLPHFYPRGAVIPTSSELARGAHAELRARPAVAYALAGNEAIRALGDDDPCSLHFALKSIDYVASGSNVHYNGCNGSHLYLAVWADAMNAALLGAAMPEPIADPPHDDDADPVSPEHRAARACASAARAELDAMREAMDPRRFAPPPAAKVEAVEWQPVPQSALRLTVPDGVAGARWQPIAGVEWRRALGGDDGAWVDRAVVALVDGAQRPLPITIHEDESGEGGDRCVLVLDEGAAPAVSAETLRSALRGRGDALVGVVIRKGIGAFVLLEIAVASRR